MTPALKAIVEAMIAELYRQAEAGKPGPWIDAGPLHSSDTFEAVARDVGIDGRVDLEKVARAGLEALREPDKLMEEAALAEEGCGCPCCVSSDDWAAMFGAIRGEKP